MIVLLLNPPTRDKKKFIREGRCTQEQGFWATLWPPVSLATIGAVLEQDDHQVVLIDCPARGMGWDELLQSIARLNPGCVLWSTGTPTITTDLSLAAEIKKISPSAHTAVFGTHVTVLDTASLEHTPELDIVIRHEPELTVRELVQSLQEGKGLEDVAGITYRDREGALHRNPDRPFLENLDLLPFPAWHHVQVADYRLPLKSRPFLIVAPQRGCPFQCSFCTCQTYYGRRLRQRSVNSVLDEMEYDRERFRVRDFFFWAETFVIDRQYVSRLCTGICDRRMDISWTCNSRVDTVTEELLHHMAAAGCWMISFGIESADQGVLDRAEKGIKVEQVRAAVEAARKAGIKTAGHFILGLPGDTLQSLEKTICFAQSLDLDIAQFYCCVPFPGSRLYDQACSEGWISTDDFSCFTQRGAVMHLPTVTPSAVMHARAQAYRSFYGRPRAWYRIGTLLADGSLSGIWQAVRNFLR